MKELFKKFTNILLVFVTLFNTVASPLTVMADTPNKGDMKLEENGVNTQYGTEIGDFITTTGGSLNSDGDVQITKKVIKKNDTGLYTVEITVEGKDYKTVQNKPIYTIFVLDASDSMTRPGGIPWTNAKTAAINFSNTLVTKYNQNKIALITFSNNTLVNKGFSEFVSGTSTRAFINSDFGNTGNGTNYYKGLKPAYDLVTEIKSGDKDAIVNVIFISDGDPSNWNCQSNCSSFEISGGNLPTQIKGAGAKLYTLAYNLSSSSDGYKLLSAMSSTGEVISTTSDDINNKLQSIATDITRDSAAHNAIATDKLGSQFTFVQSNTNTSGVTVNNGVVSYNIGEIKEGETYTFQFDIQVDVNTTEGWTFTNDTSNIKVTENGKVLASIDKSAEVYWEKNTYDYKVEYYYGGEYDSSKDETGNVAYGTSISNYIDKNIPGYKLEKVTTTDSDNSIPLVVSDDVSKNIIKVYYVKDSYNYTVEYYYNGVIDNTLTETKSALFESEISTYTDKVKPGYKFEKVETLESDKTLPLAISIDSTKNVIKVYYVTDDAQTKELKYTVEYYKDGVLQSSDTQIETTTVQFLEPDTLIVDKTKINTTNKYYGYKLEKTDPETIPNVINNNGVIKVYYVIDENNKKELSYTVEYYKDGVLQSSDTQRETTSVQVLEPDTMTVDKTKINTVNKYDGYKFQSTNPGTIPDTINNGGVIKVYYVKDSFNYSVEYYYDGIIDNTKTETGTALFQSEITSYTDKVKTGYKLEKAETTEVGNNTLPLTISSNSANNIIKVYYVKDSYGYKVEYYYDGNLDDSKTYTSKAEYMSQVTTYPAQDKVGYSFEKTENLPLTIDVDTTKNIIKVYYVSNIYDYTIKHVEKGNENNVLDIETGSSNFGSTIKVNSKTFKGFTYDSQDKESIVIDVENNTATVYYTRNTYDYTIKHVEKGNETNVLDTEKGSADFEEVIEVNSKTFEGFTYDSQDKESIVIDVENNTATVYYTRNAYDYTIKHVEKDNEENVLETETGTANFEDVIEVNSKTFEGFTYDSQDKESIVIDVENNTATVYYTRNTYDYTIKHVEKGNETNVLDTEKGSADFEDVIEVNSKTFEGFTYDSQDKESIVIDVENNTATVYYTRNAYDYTIKHVEKDNEENVLETEKGAANFEETINIVEKEFTGFTYDSKDKETIVIDVENNTATVYYTRNTYDYTIKHVEKGNETNVLDTEKGSADFEDVIEVNSKTFKGFTYDSQDKESIVIDVENNTATVYYTRNTYDYTIKHVEKGNENNVLETEKGTASFEETINVVEKEFTGFTYDSKDKETIVIDVENNTATVYYTRNTYDYTIKHVEKGNENNVLDTETGIANFEDVIEVNSKTFKGFTYDSQDKESIVIDVENNTATVYYTRNVYDYTIKHVEKGNETNVLDTEKGAADFEDVIEVNSKTFKGFTYDSQDKESIVIDVENNTATVYYTRNAYDYTIKHVEKGNENNVLETEKGTASFEETINVVEKEFTGFTYDSKDKETIVIDVENNIATVYYTRNTYDYTIKHVELGNENNVLETETGTANFEDVIEVNSKAFKGFTYDSQDKESIVIDVENNTATVYYTRNTYDYTIKHVELGNEENVLETEKGTANFEETINVVEKEFTGFTYDSKDKETIVIDVENNTATVYYTRNAYDYTIKHVELGNENNVLETETGTANFEDIIEVNSKTFEGFTYDSQDKENIVIDVENNTATVYYTRNTYDYTIKHVELGNEENVLETEKGTASFEETINVVEKEFTGFTYDSKDKETIVIDVENNTATVYYTRNLYSYSVEYYKENLDGEFEIVSDDTVIYENVLFESETTYVVNEYEGYTYDETKTENSESIVPANNDLVIRLYYTLDESEVIVHYVVKVDDNYIPFDKYGRDELGNNTPDFAGVELEDDVLVGKFGAEFTTKYREVLEYTLLGIYEGNILENTNLAKLPGTEVTSTFEVETKEYTYVYEAPKGDGEELPPQTGFEGSVNYFSYGLLMIVVYLIKKYFDLINIK